MNEEMVERSPSFDDDIDDVDFNSTLENDRTNNVSRFHIIYIY